MGNKIKTLFLDIETSPNDATIWRPGHKINVPWDAITKERAIICISYKWAHEKKVHNVTWNTKTLDDKQLLKKISKVIHEADIIVGHNIKKFDIKWIKGRLLHHRLPPLGSLTLIDTLSVSRKNFNLNSHSLDYLARFLGLKGKLSHPGKVMWDGCRNRDDKSLKMMVKYCDQDVRLLEEIYDILMVHDPSLHRGKIMTGFSECCALCGGNNLTKNGLYYTASGNKRQKLICKDCRAHFKITL